MDNDKFEIRRVEASESSQLTQLAHLAKSYWGYSPEFMLAFDEELTFHEEDLSDEKTLFRVGTFEGEICAFYALRFDLGNEVEMTALFVAPTMLGRGMGRRLFEHAVEQARQRGAHKMMIHSDPYAEKFYIKMGAVKIGDVPSRSVEDREIPLLEYVLKSE